MLTYHNPTHETWQKVLFLSYIGYSCVYHIFYKLSSRI